MANPTVFIGSSKEGLEFARAVRGHLSDDADVTMWNEGFFSDKLSHTYIDVLVKSSPFDFAVLVLTPDDLIRSREVESPSPRDNLLFELGLFMGRVGQYRTFCLHQAGIKIPSDLAGVVMATYSWPREDENYRAAVGKACDEIRKAIRALGPSPERSSAQITQMRKEVNQQEEKLTDQQKIINQLVIFSMSKPIYDKLRSLYLSRNGGEYIYGGDYEEATRREFLFLRDHGYLAKRGEGLFDPGPHLIGQNIVPLVELTPVGNFYVEQRQELEAKLESQKDSLGET